MLLWEDYALVDQRPSKHICSNQLLWEKRTDRRSWGYKGLWVDICHCLLSDRPWHKVKGIWEEFLFGTRRSIFSGMRGLHFLTEAPWDIIIFVFIYFIQCYFIFLSYCFISISYSFPRKLLLPDPVTRERKNSFALYLIVRLQPWRFGGMWSTPSLPLLPGPHWSGVVAPVRVPSMGQIELVLLVWHLAASDGEAPVLEMWRMWSTR